MGMHRLTIELDEDAYDVLRAAVSAGRYTSESEAIADLIPELRDDAESLFDDDAGLKREVMEACAEADEHPERLLNGERAVAFLTEERHARRA